MEKPTKLLVPVVLTFLLVLAYQVFGTYSSGPYGNYPNPGHHPGEIGPGTFNPSGMSNPYWVFPGNVNVSGDIRGSNVYVSGNIHAHGDICTDVQCLNSITSGEDVWSKSGNNIYYNDGNVGIGTTNPQTKLDVNGNIHASGDVRTDGGLEVQGNIKMSSVTIKGDGSTSTGLNADKLDGYHASDLLAAGGGGGMICKPTYYSGGNKDVICESIFGSGWHYPNCLEVIMKNGIENSAIAFSCACPWNVHQNCTVHSDKISIPFESRYTGRGRSIYQSMYGIAECKENSHIWHYILRFEDWVSYSQSTEAYCHLDIIWCCPP